ncbi:Crp/Fnr family transcriptional regulator [Cyanobacterium aponinum FACHB-4101]|uniref:Crp/Fnr family transcriptional regulator n=1 Tax=Cyanobacterium aponinum TaxID=379064 RepID=UPI00168106DC|nr:Crp/Fnr family transcriptional regulator [Cyanobacterium aponinum]MBD2392686.1 Crp/Fnr family transcriptional regulator [Cyanobacterium aponinum FACHB-4101]
MLLGYPSNHNLKTQLRSGERRLHFYERGEEIPLIAQGIWQVNRGVVQLFKVGALGEETLLGWSQTGNFFGLWFTNLDTFQAKALSDVYLQWFSLEEIENNPNLAQKILTETVTRIRQTEELLAIATLKRIEERLLKLLNLLGAYLGETKEDKIRIKVRFTHQNLADAIGTTRVTVTRLLGDMQKQKLISLDSNRHLLLHFS